MATWHEFQREAPALAAAVHARFAATKHHVLATLRRDGSPRVSGTEVAFEGEDLTFGSMWGAVKALDLRRDGRCALHANPGDGSMEGGDAKVAGVAVEVLDDGAETTATTADQPPDPFHLFRLDLTEAVLTSVQGDELVMEVWRPGKEVARHRRK